MNQYFKDKVVWITGASSGIGEALVFAFAKAGAKVVLSSRRPQELKRVQKEAGLSETNSLVLPLDLEKKRDFSSETKKVIQKLGGLDLVIHNGGISQRSLAKDTQIEVFDKLMAVNYTGSVALTLATLPHFRKQKSGSYAVITSIVGKVGTPLRSGYSASKHALHGFFDALRAENADMNLNVLLVLPGFIKTNVSINALVGSGVAQGKMDEAQSKGLAPSLVADKILKALASGKQEIAIGGMREHFALFMKRFFPKILASILKNAKVT